MNTKKNHKMMVVSNNYIEDEIFYKKMKANLFAKATIIFPKVGMSIHTNKKRILNFDSGIDNNIMGLSVKDKNKLLPFFLLEIFIHFIELKEIASKSNPPSISETNLK